MSYQRNGHAYHDRFRNLPASESAFLASIRSVQGIPNYIDPDKPPTSFKDALSRPYAQEWADVHQKEHQGFKDRNAFATVMLPKGAKVPGTTTLRNYTIANSVSRKSMMVRMCVRGEQQRDGVDFSSADHIRRH